MTTEWNLISMSSVNDNDLYDGHRLKFTGVLNKRKDGVPTETSGDSNESGTGLHTTLPSKDPIDSLFS